MAKLSLNIVRFTLALACFCLLGGLYYLLGLRDTYWAWAIPYALLTGIPVALLIFYHWILSNLMEAPEQLAEFKGAIIRFWNEHPKDARAVVDQKFSAIGKWQTYRLIGRVLKDLASGTDQALTLTGNFKSLALMANPLFWLALALSVFISLGMSGILSLAFALHFFLN